MAKENKRLAQLQGEMKNLEDYLAQLKVDEPEAYQQEFAEINKKLQDLRVEHFAHLINVYKRQNPEKYNAINDQGFSKKDALEAKLQYLKDGGDPKLWNYATWLKVNKSVQKLESSVDVNKDVKVDPQTPATVSEPKPEFKCDQCEFVTTSNVGLSSHKRHKHKE